MAKALAVDVPPHFNVAGNSQLWSPPLEFHASALHDGPWQLFQHLARNYLEAVLPSPFMISSFDEKPAPLASLIILTL